MPVQPPQGQDERVLEVEREIELAKQELRQKRLT